MSKRQPVSTDAAPEAIGPYSQGIVHGGLLYCSGALPLEPGSGELVTGTIEEETERCLTNLNAVCQAQGTSLNQALQVTLYTTAMEEFAAINATYASFFAADAPPARAAVGVAALPKQARIEAAAIVAI